MAQQMRDLGVEIVLVVAGRTRSPRFDARETPRRRSATASTPPARAARWSPRRTLALMIIFNGGAWAGLAIALHALLR